MAATTIPQKAIDKDGSDCWMSQHKRFCLKAVEREPDGIFIGDGVIRMLEFTELWRTHIEPLHCLNFGIFGDTVQNVLWRLQNGELDDCKARAVVLHVGSSNTESAEDIIAGILNLVDVILNKNKAAQLIILGMLPVGEQPNDHREKMATINRGLRAPLKATRGASFIEPDWDMFLSSSAADAPRILSHRDMFDYKHPTEQGCRKLCESQLVEELQSALNTYLHTSGVEETGDSDCPP